MSTRRTRWQLSLLAGLGLAFATGCSDEPEPEPQPQPQPEQPPAYEATIRRTAHGIPHIQAKDFGGLGYGQGYAFAKDHVCILADQILKVRGERARYLGQGPQQFYAGSDFAYRLLDLPGRARTSFPQQSTDLQALLKGYAAGYNRYVAETPPANLPQPCKGADWVKPITEIDLLAYHFSVGLAASSYQLILAIAAATPPTTTGGGVGVPPPGSFKVQRPDASQVGSNGWALGKGKSAGGGGMVVANPHFPWEGELKLWESQLTVPGQLNVYGVGLLGVPAVLIGFNENVAWTHTFSSGQRMTLYRLPLVKDKPTTYLYEGEERQMTAQDITILVKLPEGSLTNVTRRMYSSHYGPIFEIPGMAEWDGNYAFSFRDANIENTQLVAQFLGMDRARNLQEFKNVYANIQGIPWVNTMAADKEGNTWYTDSAPTPHLSQEAIDAWRASIGPAGTPGHVEVAANLFNNMGLVLLDGSKRMNEWQVEAGARSPGLVPFSKVPKLDREDFVFNSNDSYWLANPTSPLTGFSPLHGSERTGQSPRTRMNARLLMEVGENTAAGADGKFTVAELQNAILNNRSMTAELIRAQVAQRCQGRETGTYTLITRTPTGETRRDVTSNIRQACDVITAWTSNRFDKDEVGAVMWREFAGSTSAGTHTNGGSLYNVPFNPDDPIYTPRELKPHEGTGNDFVLGRLALATDTLRNAGFALDSKLGDVQYTTRVSGERIPIHGGMLTDGTANVVSFGDFKSTTDEAEFSAVQGNALFNSRTGLTDLGYVINNGTSFVMAMEFTPQGPKGRAVLSYSQSSDPASDYYADQTRMFSNKEWRDILFTEDEVTRGIVGAPVTISGN